MPRRRGRRDQGPRRPARAGHAPRPRRLLARLPGNTRTCCSPRTRRNAERLWGAPNRTPYVKDGIDEAVVHGRTEAVNPDGVGTKVAAHYRFDDRAGRDRDGPACASRTSAMPQPFADAERIFADRIAEADALYAALAQGRLTEDEARVQRQALAGLIWSKQFFNFDVAQWLDGDPAGPPPPEARKHGRNSQWRHHNSGDVISMPDKWEYPWYAAWDLAFHCVAFGLVDPGFAKDQLLLMLREWYMHPNGQIPAYEWAFGDVNPPVHIAAARALYQDEQRRTGAGDRDFLARIFHKLLLNFTWWVNRKDEEGKNLFQGGFLGLDNISVIDRSMGLPPGLTPGAGGRHRLDGDLLPEHGVGGARAVPGRSGLRRPRHQVPRALPGHRRGDERTRRRGSQPLGRGGRLLLRLRPPRRTASGCR